MGGYQGYLIRRQERGDSPARMGMFTPLCSVNSEMTCCAPQPWSYLTNHEFVHSIQRTIFSFLNNRLWKKIFFKYQRNSYIEICEIYFSGGLVAGRTK